MIVLILMLLAAPVGAQESGPERARVVDPTEGREVEPEQPELVLPEVVLRIEDLSVDKIVTDLPEPDEVLPPEREAPLPGVQEWSELDIALPPLGEGLAPGGPSVGGERNLYADAVLGAGAPNHVYGSVSLYRVGEAPRFGLEFVHEMQDRLALEEPGSGYHQRFDLLEGELRLEPERWLLDANGHFRDEERGLQEISPFVERSIREASASVDTRYQLRERIELGAGIDVDYTSDLLGGDDSQISAESIVAPMLLGAFQSDRLRLELRADYRLRLEETDTQSIRTDLGVLWQISDRLETEASAGWFLGTEQTSLFPFRVALSGSIRPITFEIGGGYFVEEPTWRDVLAVSPFLELPELLEVNHGWFAEAGLALTLTEQITLGSEARFSLPSQLPEPAWLDAGGVNPATGLVPLAQSDLQRLQGEVSLRWNPLRALRLELALETELMERPAGTPVYLARFDGEGTNAAGTWGANLSVRYEIENDAPGDDAVFPLVDVGAFTRLSDRLTLSLEAEDLLWPALDEPRASTFPFEDPGVGAILKLQISF